jgi:hypothetical protein
MGARAVLLTHKRLIARLDDADASAVSGDR